MADGWVKLHRGLVDWEWYDDHNTTRLFIHCIMRANHQPKKWRGIDINRGQFYTSLETLSVETGLTHSQLRTSLNKLKVTGEVTGSSMARGRMLTVFNYDSYQCDDRLDVSRVTGLRQANDRLMTANKKDKKEKNDKNDSSSDDDAEIVWKAYPNKQGKKRAIPAIKKALKKYSIDELKTKIDNYVKSCRDPKYLAHGCTWFCNERYEDDLTPIKPKYEPKFGSL